MTEASLRALQGLRDLSTLKWYVIPYHSLSADPKERILGVPNRWFWAIGYSAFCAFVEILLNKGGHLVWEYPFWSCSLGGVWLIFFFGYLHFYVAAMLVIRARAPGPRRSRSAPCMDWPWR